MLIPERPEEGSAAIRERVIGARAFRAARLARFSPGGDSGGRTAGPRLLEEQSRLGKQAKGLLREALLKHGLGGRGYVRTINLSRTIADLDNQVEVNADHVAEALALRLDCRRIGFG
jgi:magnesium chelatase family protein